MFASDYVKVDGVFVGGSPHECMSVMDCLCTSVLACFYAYINMVVIFMHEVMVCGWYGHAVMTGFG